MSYKLFLDDERQPAQVKWVPMPLGPWVIVKNYQEFVEAIETRGLPTHVSFDHDLAIEHYPIFENKPGMFIPYDSYKEKTGYHAAQFLIEYCKKHDYNLPHCTIHTMNVTGKHNIKNILSGYAHRRKHYPARPEGIIIPGRRSCEVQQGD